MVYLILGLVLLTAIAYGVTFKTAKQKAVGRLHQLLFPRGVVQQKQVLDEMNRFTRNRFPEKELLDYFMKIKGLQTVNLNDPVDFWTRRFLMQPTRIRLNYFEQVKFYETFLNFPEAKGKKEDLHARVATLNRRLHAEPAEKVGA